MCLSPADYHGQSVSGCRGCDHHGLLNDVVNGNDAPAFLNSMLQTPNHLDSLCDQRSMLHEEESQVELIPRSPSSATIGTNQMVVLDWNNEDLYEIKSHSSGNLKFSTASTIPHALSWRGQQLYPGDISVDTRKALLPRRSDSQDTQCVETSSSTVQSTGGLTEQRSFDNDNENLCQSGSGNFCKSNDESNGDITRYETTGIAGIHKDLKEVFDLSMHATWKVASFVLSKVCHANTT